jgi:hypothetical protein
MRRKTGVFWRNRPLSAPIQLRAGVHASRVSWISYSATPSAEMGCSMGNKSGAKPRKRSMD